MAEGYYRKVKGGSFKLPPMKGGDNMCEWLMMMALLFGCEVCDQGCFHEISINQSWGNLAYVSLINNCEIRGIEFTLKPCKPRSVYPINRASGFFADYDQETGQVILISLSGDKIQPGIGRILEIVLDDDYSFCVLTDVKIVE